MIYGKKVVVSSYCNYSRDCWLLVFVYGGVLLSPGSDMGDTRAKSSVSVSEPPTEINVNYCIEQFFECMAAVDAAIAQCGDERTDEWNACRANCPSPPEAGDNCLADCYAPIAFMCENLEEGMVSDCLDELAGCRCAAGEGVFCV